MPHIGAATRSQGRHVSPAEGAFGVIDRIAYLIGVPIRLISLGPEREATFEYV